MHIVLLQPPFEDFYATPIRFYPLGLAYVAAVLRRQGHTVTLLDALTPLRKRTLALPHAFLYLKDHLQNTPHFFRHYCRYGREEDALLQEIAALRADVVGITAQFTAYYKNVHELATRIKTELGVAVMVGGNHATAFPEEIRRRTPAIDAVVSGPAENGLASALARLNIPAPLPSVDWREMPPAHDLIPGDAYRIGVKNYASLIASRGCPVGCAFCSVQNMFGKRIQCRTVASVVAEMSYLYHERQVRIFNFEDDHLTANRAWFMAFLQAIEQDASLEEIELTAMNGLCYATLDGEVLASMWRAGFRRLNLSLVTQSAALRKIYQRPDRGVDIEPVVRTARRLGFQITVYLIMGLPEQTREEIKQTIDYLLSLNVLVGPSVFYLPAGSPLMHRLKVSADILADWNLYRSSAFAVATDHVSREELIALFVYARAENLSRLDVDRD